MEKYDIVIIGGGHNGLIVAAYLAKAGLNVCVVEKSNKVGGGVLTEESTLPGFKHDPFSIEHGVIQTNPLITQDELDLKSKYGLRYITQDPGHAIIFPDNRALVFYKDIDKTCQSISRFSERDAEAYRRFYQACQQMGMLLEQFMFSPPPALGNMISFLEASEEGREYLGLILSSAMDVAEDWFESEQMRTALVRSTSETLVSPQQKGTGNFVFKFAVAQSWVSIPEGGSGVLSEALEACLRDNGATIKVSSTVSAVKIEAGEAKGVILDIGEEIIATKAVISNVNVKQLFLEMLEPAHLPQGFQEKVRRIRSATLENFVQNIALNQAPQYEVGGDVNKALSIQIVPSLENLLRMYDEIRYGIPVTKSPFLSVPTIVDPTRAPEGKHTMYLLHHAPYNLNEGGPSRWDEIKEEVADGVLGTVRNHTTNLGPENILGRFIRSPLDLERHNPAWIEGDPNHIGLHLSQLFACRPLPGWGQYKTPVKKLYMCGSSTHPGGAVSGGGRVSVQVIMEDLGIDFKKTIS